MDITRLTTCGAVFISALLLAVAVGCGGTVDDNGDAPEASGSYTTEDDVELQMQFDPDPPEVGQVDLVVDLVFDNEPLEGADIEIEPWMPAHGHGANTTPVVHHQGEGTYQVDDLSFSMSGHWELRIEIDDDIVETEATIDVEVQ